MSFAPRNGAPSGTVIPMVAERNEKSAKSASQPSSRIRRNRLIALLIALALVGGAWFAFFGSKDQTIVPPGLVGMTVRQADAILAPLGLHSTIADAAFREDIPKGAIISTKPGGGGAIKPGGTVLLYISKGVQHFTVPATTGLTPAAAAALIGSNSLIVGTTSEAFSAKIPVGMIISTIPIAGSQVARTTTINFLMSKGIEELPMDSYLGKSGEQALNELNDAGFSVTASYTYSDSVAAGIVISQKPDGGVSAVKGTKIILLVTKGSQSVFIPNVYSFTTAKASAMLEGLDLQVLVKKIGTRVGKVVIDISPKVGTSVLRGSSVTITVG